MRPMAWLDRNMGVTILVAATLVLSGLAYAAVRDAPVRENILKRVDLAAGEYRASVAYAKGSDKPILYSPDERTLLDVSAWESVLTVNGTRQPLYRLEYNTASDGNVVHITWGSPAFALEQRIELREDGLRIDWSWLRAPRSGSQLVDLEVGLFAYWMESARFDGTSVTYRLAATDPRYPPPLAGVADTRDYAVNVTFDRAPDGLWFGETPDGVDGVHARFVLLDAPAGAVVPFFSQRVTYERTDAPRPPSGDAERRGIPFQAGAADEASIAAGAYAASIPLGKGTDKPLLREKDGRHLLDYSAWASTLRVNGTLQPLYALEYNVTTTREDARIAWRGEGFTLEERVSLTDARAELVWVWRADAGGASQEVELDVARFGRYLENASLGAQAVAFTLPARDPAFPDEARGDAPYAVRLDFDRPPARTLLGETPEGVDSVRTSFRFRAEPGEEKVVLHERVTFRRGEADALDGAPAPRVAVPVEDPAARALLLHAGDYRASVAHGKGSDKPLVRHADGTTLLEWSGWETNLWVNGEGPVPLYRHEYLVNLTGELPCIDWLGVGYTLRQCLEVTADGVVSRWAWRQDDERVRDFILEIAHFAPFGADARVEGQTMRYSAGGHDLALSWDAPAFATRFGVGDERIDAFRLEYRFALRPGAFVPLFAERLAVEDAT